MNPKVDFYFTKEKTWHKEIAKLRTIILDCGLTEELKWGCPCYTQQKKNIVLIHVFKEYCAILFIKGSMLTDPKGVLVQQTKNVQASRQIRFESVRDITAMESTIKSYIDEAILLEKAGLKVNFSQKTQLVFPEELHTHFAKNKKFKAAFDALTPGRQRAYNLHFTGAKQSKTRESRIEKCIPQILDGRGLNE